MAHTTNEIIPFGKYKGQPLEILENDPQYKQWLLAQDWFRDKFKNHYTIIINNFSTVDNTPEHNLLQIKFMQPEFIIKFLICVQAIDKTKIPIPEVIKKSEKCDFSIGELYWKTKEDIKIQFEQKGWDVAIQSWNLYYHIKDSEGNVIKDSEDNVWEGLVKWNTNYFASSRNQTLGWVRYDLELKPIIGDDYPVFLRDLKNRSPVVFWDKKILLYSQYSGSVPEELMQLMFKNEEIITIKEEEINKIIYPF